MTTQSDPIIHDEDVDAALDDLARRVKLAEEAIRGVLAENPGARWTIRDLQDRAAKVHGLSPSVMSIAFLRLLKADEVRVDDDETAHAPA